MVAHDLFEPFGPYMLLRPLGRGGMGVVYTARAQDELHPLVALKRMRADAAVPTFEERFRHECALALRLRHPHLVETLEAGEIDGQHFVASQLIRGQDLATISQRLGQTDAGMPLAAVVRVMSDVLSALRYVHSATEEDGRALRLVHRDVTPGNVLVGYDGRSHLADFGLATSLLTDSLGLTAEGMFIGTPRFMAPELLTGTKASVQSDLYALGAVAYCLLTGGGPYSGSTKEIILAIMEGPPSPLRSHRPDLPASFLALLDRLMARSKAARPSSAEEADEMLNSVAQREGVWVSHGAVGAWLSQLFAAERQAQDEQWRRDLQARLASDHIGAMGTRVLPTVPRPLSGDSRVPPSSPDMAVKAETLLGAVAPLTDLEPDREPDTDRSPPGFMGAVRRADDLLANMPTIGASDFRGLIAPAPDPAANPVTGAGPHPGRSFDRTVEAAAPGLTEALPAPEAVAPLPLGAPGMRPPPAPRPMIGAVPVVTVRPASSPRPAEVTPNRGSPTVVNPVPPRGMGQLLAGLLVVALVAIVAGAVGARVGTPVSVPGYSAEQVAVSERLGAVSARLSGWSKAPQREALEASLNRARALNQQGQVQQARSLVEQVERALSAPAAPDS